MENELTKRKKEKFPSSYMRKENIYTPMFNLFTMTGTKKRKKNDIAMTKQIFFFLFITRLIFFR